MCSFKKKVPEVDPKEEALRKRLKAVEVFAPIGSFIEYLGVKMMVVKHHEMYFRACTFPGIHVEWMDSMQRLQKAFIRDWEFPLCKIISTPENKESAATVAQQTNAADGPMAHA